MPLSDSTNRYIAFLRAINVGGRTIKMDELRSMFEAQGLANVETFIASGNVIFESDLDAPTLETRIDDYLASSLGYRVEVFLRTSAELANILDYKPFTTADMARDGATLHIAFTAQPVSHESTTALQDARTSVDQLHAHEREVYWLIQGKMSDSKITLPQLNKLIGAPYTVRNSNTIRRLVAKYPPA